MKNYTPLKIMLVSEHKKEELRWAFSMFIGYTIGTLVFFKHLL